VALGAPPVLERVDSQIRRPDDAVSIRNPHEWFGIVLITELEFGKRSLVPGVEVDSQELSIGRNDHAVLLDQEIRGGAPRLHRESQDLLPFGLLPQGRSRLTIEKPQLLIVRIAFWPDRADEQSRRGLLHLYGIPVELRLLTPHPVPRGEREAGHRLQVR